MQDKRREKGLGGGGLRQIGRYRASDPRTALMCVRCGAVRASLSFFHFFLRNKTGRGQKERAARNDGTRAFAPQSRHSAGKVFFCHTTGAERKDRRHGPAATVAPSACF